MRHPSTAELNSDRNAWLSPKEIGIRDLCLTIYRSGDRLAIDFVELICRMGPEAVAAPRAGGVIA
jgi:hypothetical protein